MMKNLDITYFFKKNLLERKKHIFTLMISLLTTNAVAELNTIYVSPEGQDSNSGSIYSPLKSLHAAQIKFREILTENDKQNITVKLADGSYSLDKTLVLGLEDSPADGYRLTIEAQEGATPIINSDVAISGWKKVEKLPNSFSKEAKGNLWVTEVPRGLFFKTMYQGDIRLPRARTSGFIAQAKNVTGRNYDWQFRDLVRYPVGAMRNWENLEDIEIYSRGTKGYIANYLPLKSVDEKNQIAYTTIKATYQLAALHEYEFGGVNTWVENVPEGLTKPGEWVLNSQTNDLFYWPIDNKRPGAVVAPSLKEYILVQGEVTHAIDGDKPAGNITIDGLTFTRGERDTWTTDDKGVQHDWGMWDKDNSLVRLRGAKNVEILNSRFHNTGGGAIRLDRYAQNNRISHNEIYRVGESAIFLSGYGPGKKDVNKYNTIDNNRISFTSELWWATPSILISQSGHNTIRNNHISNSPYALLAVTGVRPRFWNIWGTKPNIKLDYLEWAEQDLRENMQIIRWEETGRYKDASIENYFHILKNWVHAGNNLIQDNEFHNGNEFMGDGNPVYLSTTGDGNIFRRNVIYNSRANGADLRLDDDQFNTLLEDNIIIGSQGRGGVRVKHDNQLINNILINIPVSFGNNNTEKNILTHNIFYSAENGFTPKSGIHWRRNKVSPIAKDMIIDHNLYIAKKTNDKQRLQKNFNSSKQNESVGEHSRFSTESVFIDAENYDFRLKNKSLAQEMGIKSIDIFKIGLELDPTFKRFQKSGIPEYVNEHTGYLDYKNALGKHPGKASK